MNPTVQRTLQGIACSIGVLLSIFMAEISGHTSAPDDSLNVDGRMMSYELRAVDAFLRLCNHRRSFSGFYNDKQKLRYVLFRNGLVSLLTVPRSVTLYCAKPDRKHTQARGYGAPPTSYKTDERERITSREQSRTTSPFKAVSVDPYSLSRRNARTSESSVLLQHLGLTLSC